MNRYVCLIAAAALGACATTADEESAESPQAVAAAEAAAAGESEDSEDEEGGLICKSIRQTGTKFRRKVCGTKEQWAYSRERGREAGDAIRKSTSAQTARDNVDGG